MHIGTITISGGRGDHQTLGHIYIYTYNMYKSHKWNKALSSTAPSWPERRGYVQVRTPHRWNPREIAESLQEASQIAPSAVAQMSNAFWRHQTVFWIFGPTRVQAQPYS